jgi:hypothetical protein
MVRAPRHSTYAPLWTITAAREAFKKPTIHPNVYWPFALTNPTSHFKTSYSPLKSRPLTRPVALLESGE